MLPKIVGPGIDRARYRLRYRCDGLVVDGPSLLISVGLDLPGCHTISGDR